MSRYTECEVCGEDMREVEGEDICRVCEYVDDEHDQFNSDAEADADALASAGYGTDEDYGYFGEDDDWFN
jgi:hypothetical protein